MKKTESSNPYEDIIHLPHPVSRRHPPMPISDRAAQFAPFAALTGYGDVVKEAARLTEQKIELSEDQRVLLDERFRQLARALRGEAGEMCREAGESCQKTEKKQSGPEAVITYFLPDHRKEGGSYITVVGRVRKIDEFRQMVRLTDGTEIPIEDILDIQ